MPPPRITYSVAAAEHCQHAAIFHSSHPSRPGPPLCSLRTRGRLLHKRLADAHAVQLHIVLSLHKPSCASKGQSSDKVLSDAQGLPGMNRRSSSTVA